MPQLEEERIGIVGLGAIGGSLALAVKDRVPTLAWSRDGSDRDAAEAAGITVCRAERWATEITASTLIVLAVPLDELAGVVRELLPRVADTCLVMHASSLQRVEALALAAGEYERVLGTHPIAGSERSGFGAAHPAMFRGATIRAESRASAAARTRSELIWGAAGASRFVWDEASTHDALMAWTSHLPQLTATALAAALADHGASMEEAGPGARDTTRLAASDFAVWAPILERAPRETIEALRRLTSTLGELGRALETRRPASVAPTWQRGRAWRSRPEDQT